MKPRAYLPKYRLTDKISVYSGAPVNRGFYERNLNKAKTIYMNNCCKTPKLFYRRRQDRAFNQLLNNYYDEYNKFQKKHKFMKNPTKPVKRQENNFNFNQYELKKKNLSVLFFTYDLKNNEEMDFNITDQLINSMYNGKDETLIKSTQIKKDYEARLNENKKIKDDIQYNNFIDDKDKFSKKKTKIEFNEEVSSGDQSSSIKRENEPIIRKKTKEQLKRTNDIKENEDDENIFFLEDGDNVLDDNYLEFKNNIYLDSKLPLFKDIINSDFQDNYDPPIYIIPQSVLNEEENNRKKMENQQNLINLQKKQTINKYKDGELKRFKDIIVDNKYPCFEQLTNPYYQTNYIPPPCFPKLPEDIDEEENDEYGYEDFGFIDKKNEIIEEDDEALILLNNQITNNEFPMFEHLIRNDYKGNYIPPTYKIPSHIEKSLQNEKEKIEKDRENYEKHKKTNVENDVNRYDNNELKMIDSILKDDQHPLFEQIINPYHQTNYIPPEVFPKKELLEEENQDEENYENEFVSDNNEKNDDKNKLELINSVNINSNEEFPLFEHLIRNDFKGNYAPPIYKIPDYMKEVETKSEENKKNIQELKGKYVNYDNYNGNEYPTVAKMINSNFEEEKKDENNIADKDEKNENDNNNDENEYNDFE
jgi:hypothetical protein